MQSDQKPCTDCGGIGQTGGKSCEHCNGTGHEPLERESKKPLYIS